MPINPTPALSHRSLSLGPRRRPSVDGEPSSRPAGLTRKLPSRRRSPEGEPDSKREPPLFPSRLFRRPTTVFVYGPCRPLVDLTLIALAEATNPEFQWLEIGIPGEEQSQFDPVRLGWVPEDRLWRVECPDSLRPSDVGLNLVLFGLVRSDESSETLVQVTEFLRLPDISQRILAQRPPDGAPGVVVVTNAHRVMAAFSPNRVPGILTVHTNAGFSVLVGYSDSPGAACAYFDFVFHVVGESVPKWRDGRVVCEKGIDAGPLGGSRPLLLPKIPLLSSVLSRASSE